MRKAIGLPLFQPARFVTSCTIVATLGETALVVAPLVQVPMPVQAVVAVVRARPVISLAPVVKVAALSLASPAMVTLTVFVPGAVAPVKVSVAPVIFEPLGMFTWGKRKPTVLSALVLLRPNSKGAPVSVTVVPVCSASSLPAAGRAVTVPVQEVLTSRFALLAPPK